VQQPIISIIRDTYCAVGASVVVVGGFGRLKSALGRINGAATDGEISVVAMNLQARAGLDAELAALLGAAQEKRVRAVSTPWLRRGGQAECKGAHGGGRWT
jgi:hypothetical protein